MYIPTLSFICGFLKTKTEGCATNIPKRATTNSELNSLMKLSTKHTFQMPVANYTFTLQTKLVKKTLNPFFSIGQCLGAFWYFSRSNRDNYYLPGGASEKDDRIHLRYSKHVRRIPRVSFCR